MQTEAEFIDAINHNPSDTELIGVYADLLEENGNPLLPFFRSATKGLAALHAGEPNLVFDAVKRQQEILEKFPSAPLSEQLRWLRKNLGVDTLTAEIMTDEQQRAYADYLILAGALTSRLTFLEGQHLRAYLIYDINTDRGALVDDIRTTANSELGLNMSEEELEYYIQPNDGRIDFMFNGGRAAAFQLNGAPPVTAPLHLPAYFHASGNFTSNDWCNNITFAEHSLIGNHLTIFSSSIQPPLRLQFEGPCDVLGDITLSDLTSASRISDLRSNSQIRLSNIAGLQTFKKVTLRDGLAINRCPDLTTLGDIAANSSNVTVARCPLRTLTNLSGCADLYLPPDAALNDATLSYLREGNFILRPDGYQLPPSPVAAPAQLTPSLTAPTHTTPPPRH